MTQTRLQQITDHLAKGYAIHQLNREVRLELESVYSHELLTRCKITKEGLQELNRIEARAMAYSDADSSHFAHHISALRHFRLIPTENYDKKDYAYIIKELGRLLGITEDTQYLDEIVGMLTVLMSKPMSYWKAYDEALDNFKPYQIHLIKEVA